MGKITLRAATDEDFDEMVDFDGLAFGDPWPVESREVVRRALELDRFVVAHDGGSLVGVAGAYSLELTVPGPRIEPVCGVTWVAVSPTHTRQGVLTKMMAEVHAEARRRGESMSILTSSEGGIYRRFGYGVASQVRVIDLDRRRAQILAEYQPPPGSVMLVDASNDDVFVQIEALFDRIRRGRTGDINRSAGVFELTRHVRGDGTRWAVHADGYACWKVDAKWHDGHPAHQMELYDLVAGTFEAHAALWHTVLSVDLVGPIRSYRAAALDDHLPHLLTDPRALRTTELNDMVWVHPLDVRAALGARTYGSEDALVLEVDGERWKVDGGPDGVDVRPAKRQPDLVMDRASLGAISLGGPRPSELARARRIESRSDELLRRADRFFAADRVPHCSSGF